MSKPDLTIGMCVYDDFDGVYFTTQAINAYHPELKDRIEILVLDNNPESDHGEAVADFLQHVENARYFPYPHWKSTAVRDVLFSEAQSDYVLCADSHVLFLPGAIAGLIEFYKQNVYCGDLLQGPMFYDTLDTFATHFDHTWQANMLGVWGCDQRGADPYAPPFEIEMQGLGTFACRKDGWLGFNRLFRGFGGEEWYIHEKFRQAGKKALCLPLLRWTHRFRRPAGAKYHLCLDDRVYNYFVGHLELGADVAPIFEHFKENVGPERCGQLFELAKKDLMLQPLRLINSAPEIPIVTCLMIVNNVSQMHLNEAVESFHRQHYQARELVIFNDGPNLLACDHPLVKVINYPEGLSSLDECVKTALPACNGDIICLWDGQGIELPWRISIDVEMIDRGYDFWKPGNFWRGEAEGMLLRPSHCGEFSIASCVLRREWLAENSLDGMTPTEGLEWSRLATIGRNAEYADQVEPIVIETGWRMDYAKLASAAAVKVANEMEADNPTPTFLAVCDIVSWAEEAIEHLNRIGGLKIILVDNASTNPAMTEFLNGCPHEVIKLEKRLPQDQIWSSGAHRAVDGLFVGVHSFYDLSELPDNTIEVLHEALTTLGISRCGVSVVFDDLPPYNPCRTDIRDKEGKHWEKQVGDYYETDAGFAVIMGRADRLSERHGDWHTPHRRLHPPYAVRYRPWYLDFENQDSLLEDILYYLENSIDHDLYREYRETVSGTA